MKHAVSVFGGTGFIGSRFVSMFQDDNDIYVRPRWSRRPAPEGPSNTLWFISTTDNYNVHTDPTLDVNTNLVTLCEALEQHRLNNPAGVFNFVSSWFVYGDHGSNAEVSENLACDPKGFYSITKRTAELLLQSYCQTHFIPYRILRLCNVVGPGDHYSAKKNALQYLIGKMKNNEDIEVYGNGKFYRNYMHVDDVCRALDLVMDKGQINYIYNISHPDHRYFIDHVKYVSKKINYTGNIKFIEPKQFHQQVQTPSFLMSTFRLKRDTDFRPVLSIEAMLDDLID